MKRWHNVHHGMDMHARGDSYLIIDATSCWSASRATCAFIGALSRTGSREGYLEELGSLGCENPQETFDLLRRKKILREPAPILARLWSFLREPVVPLLRGSWLGRVVDDRALRILFSPWAIGFVFALFAAMIVRLYLLPPLLNIAPVPLPWSRLTVLWILLGALAHELGHSFACARLGIGFRPIGLTWYFIWPVAYTNVSGIDLLEGKKRMLINIGGIYLQAAFMLLLYALCKAWPSAGTGSAITLLTYLILINLNPFLRSDAFWAIQDGVIDNPSLRGNKPLNALYQIGYAAFTAAIVYVVGRSTVLFFIDAYRGWRGFGSITLRQVVLFFLLTYIQILIFKGIFSRISSFVRKGGDVILSPPPSTPGSPPSPR